MLRKLTFIVAMIVIASCQVEENLKTPPAVSQDVIAKIHNLGFSTQNVQAVEDGYLVEGDIMLHDNDLNSTPGYQLLRVGDDEHYRTYNLVTGLPRNIRVAISTSLPTSYVAALDEAIRRYNAEGLRITMTRVSSSYHILLTKAPAG